MKTKTKKQPKISPYKRLHDNYINGLYAQTKLEKEIAVINTRREEQREAAEKWERAYRNLKNLIGEYMAMLAGGCAQPERAMQLEQCIFSEPGDGDKWGGMILGHTHNYNKQL